MSDDEESTDFDDLPIGPSGDTEEEAELPHWTEPGTGEIPILEEEDPGEDWSEVIASEPRWADDEEYDADLAGLASADPEPVRISTAEEDFFGYEYEEQHEAQPAAPVRPSGEGAGTAGDRNVIEATATGVVLGGAALLCFWIGKGPTLVLIAAALVLAATEFYDTLRKRGYQPATLLGIASVGAMPLATYWRFEAGPPVVLFLTILFGAVWYLAGVNEERPVPNLGVTMLGVVWIGVMGAFGALIIRLPDGISLLFSTILVTVAYDVGAYIVGRTAGRSMLSEASPNKTVEGLLGGMFAAVLVGLVLGVAEVDPIFEIQDGLILGLVIAVVAPIGDLFESVVKRDLGVKDMGGILPGHGGLLDRFDALLFVLPAAYYTARLVIF